MYFILNHYLRDYIFIYVYFFIDIQAFLGGLHLDP